MEKHPQYKILIREIDEVQRTMKELIEKYPWAVSRINLEILGMITLAYALGIIDDDEREKLELASDEYVDKLTEGKILDELL